MPPEYDVLIVGSGVAALAAACTLPDTLRVLILTKAAETSDEGCNSYWAQGGIASARDEADIPAHIEDTLAAGAGLCDRLAVELLAHKGYELVQKLVKSGMDFDRDKEGHLLYTREAAHSTERILHAVGDATGRELHAYYAKRNPHPIQRESTVVDLLIDQGRCYGVCVDRHGDRHNLYARHTILASGGFGGLYAISTNAPGILGQIQGVAALRGCALGQMHLTQFHPTVFTGTHAPQKPLLSEALRGEGARIVDENGHRFVCDRHPSGELAPRDIVARAIYTHLREGHRVYLDMSHFEPEAFRHRFPTIHAKLAEFGYDLPGQPVPIAPAFHYAMGGIVTDLMGRVPSTKGLYAVGEAACTGVHGANRLASNSLLEALVFGQIAAETILTDQHTPPPIPTLPINDQPLVLEGDEALLGKIRQILWEGAGISRTTSGLQAGADAIKALQNTPHGWLVHLSLTTAAAVFEHALSSRESIGAHHIEETHAKG